MRTLTLALVMASIAVATASCTQPSPPDLPSCLPAQLELSATDAAQGDAITVSAPAVTCDLHYDEDRTYDLKIPSGGDAGPVTVAEAVPVAADGSFVAVVHIPWSVKPRQLNVSVSGSTYDECPDWLHPRAAGAAATAASCADYSSPLLTVQRGATDRVAAAVSTHASSTSRMDALLEGTIEVNEDGCFALRGDGAEASTVILFPFGSVVDPEAQTVTVPEYGVVSIGDRVVSGGGFVPVTDDSTFFEPPNCQAEQVAVMYFE
jgi:hypothetical protein